MRILVTMPSHGRQASIGAMDAFFHPLRPDSKHRIKLQPVGSSALTKNFNDAWAVAIDAYEAGLLDAFAMIHSDVAAEVYWLDMLLDELELHRADMVSAVIPLKDDRGLTSTAFDTDLWMPRRMTLIEMAEMPTTFDAELLNTGLWVCKLGPWCLEENDDGSQKFVFDITNKIVKRSGRRVALFEPEDWKFSRQLRAAGLRIMATKALTVIHEGEIGFSNRDVWGWETDRQNRPQVMAGQELTLNQRREVNGLPPIEAQRAAIA